MKKRVSGEGLASNSASAFQEQLASIEVRAAAALAPKASRASEPILEEAQRTNSLAMLDAFPWTAEEPLKRRQASIQEAPQAKRQCTALDGVKMLSPTTRIIDGQIASCASITHFRSTFRKYAIHHRIIT